MVIRYKYSTTNITFNQVRW